MCLCSRGVSYTTYTHCRCLVDNEHSYHIHTESMHTIATASYSHKVNLPQTIIPTKASTPRMVQESLSMKEVQEMDSSLQEYAVMSSI